MVSSLEPEFEKNIHFRVADINSSEGRAFAQYHQVGNVTLVFFSKGNRITTLQGVQTEDFLRKAFKRTFKLP